MSMRTLVEINLDLFGHALQSLPSAILAEMLRRALYKGTPDWPTARADLESLGFRVHAERHHSRLFEVPAHTFRIDHSGRP